MWVCQEEERETRKTVQILIKPNVVHAHLNELRDWQWGVCGGHSGCLVMISQWTASSS